MTSKYSRFSEAANVIMILLSSFSTIAISACSHNDSILLPQVAPMIQSDLPDSVISCETKLRKQMADHSLFFVQASGFSNEAEEANALLSEMQNPSFEVSIAKNVPAILKVNFKNKSSNAVQAMSYSLRVTDGTSDFPLEIDVSHKVILNPGKNGSTSEFSQDFNVSKSCDLTLKQTQLQTSSITARTAAGPTVTIERRSLFDTGEKRAESKSAVVSNNFELMNFEDSPDDALPTPNQAIFDMSVGVVKTVNEGETEITTNDFGKMHFKGFKFKFVTADDKDLFEAFMTPTVDPKQGYINFSNSFDTNSWTLSKERWDTLHLGTAGLHNASSKIDLNYLQQHNSFIVENSKELSYDHMAAYYTISEMSGSASSGIKRYFVTEKYPPVMRDSATPADLISNNTIQTELPKIQEIRNSILSSAPTDRTKQISLILKYLSENYPYDHSMVNNNVVRPLSTQEALDRGTGVCQHFAVIFTALARSMKIPTRIVTGYALTVSPPGMHAWVETEISAGIWQVVEPQSANGLSQTYARAYFPLTRAFDLEDKDELSVQSVNAAHDNKLTFLPAQ